MPWCRSCGVLRGNRNYVSASELGIVTMARAYLAAGSPFVGQCCPGCGLGLEAGQEVEGCDVSLRHVTCPVETAEPAVSRPHIVTGPPHPATAKPPGPLSAFVAPVIGWDPVTGDEVRWMEGGGPGVALNNGHTEIWGGSGVGKTQYVQWLLAELARSNSTRFGVADFKNDYRPGGSDFAAAAGAEFVDLWHDGLAYNPLALHDDSSRAIDSAVIETRDAVAVAARAFTRMGHRQLDQLRAALKKVYQAGRAEGRWPTMLDLDALLGPDLTAVIGDLTRNQIFRDGPPLGEAIERNLVFGLTGIPGNGITQALAAGFILSSLMLRIHALPLRPNAINYVIVVDEAHRVAALKAIDTLLREGRAKGLAVILATQQPGDMPVVVGANAATRICFQLPDASSAAAAAKRLDPGDATLAGRIRGLEAGTAVVRLGNGRPRVLKMAQFYRDQHLLAEATPVFQGSGGAVRLAAGPPSGGAPLPTAPPSPGFCAAAAPTGPGDARPVAAAACSPARPLMGDPVPISEPAAEGFGEDVGYDKVCRECRARGPVGSDLVHDPQCGGSPAICDLQGTAGSAAAGPAAGAPAVGSPVDASETATTTAAAPVSVPAPSGSRSKSGLRSRAAASAAVSAVPTPPLPAGRRCGVEIDAVDAGDGQPCRAWCSCGWKSPYYQSDGYVRMLLRQHHGRCDEPGSASSPLAAERTEAGPPVAGAGQLASA
jgi:hypothetical protein